MYKRTCMYLLDVGRLKSKKKTPKVLERTSSASESSEEDLDETEESRGRGGWKG